MSPKRCPDIFRYVHKKCQERSQTCPNKIQICLKICPKACFIEVRNSSEQKGKVQKRKHNNTEKIDRNNY